MSYTFNTPCGLLPTALLELLARAARARSVAVDLGPRRPRGPILKFVGLGARLQVTRVVNAGAAPRARRQRWHRHLRLEADLLAPVEVVVGDRAARERTLLARLKRFELTTGHAAAGSDQGCLQQFFRTEEGFLSLPHAYNVLKRREKKLGKSFRIQDVFVLHLVGGKPWEPGDPGAGEYPLSHGAWHAIRRECGLPDDGY